MNLFIRIFVLLKLFTDLTSVASYTLVLKPVKPLYSPVKVYRYDVRYPKIISENYPQYVYHKPVPAQRIYEHLVPLVVKQQQQQKDSPYRTRYPVKKEKRKYLHKISSTTTTTETPDHQRLYTLSQQLVPPISTNKIEDYSEAKEEETRGSHENELPHVLLPSPHDEKSFSSFPQEKGKIYKNPGEWATPAPTTVSENTSKPIFTPSQLYLQIRHKNTVIHVPQTEALQDAETLEELINAPRLKELARTTHVQEVYSEEGYEDGAYDHAGHIRGAQHGEVYDNKDEGVFRIKETAPIIDYDSDLEESKRTPSKEINATFEENFNDKLEPRTTRLRPDSTQTSLEYGKVPQTYKGEHKYSSRVKKPFKPKGTDPQQLLPPPPPSNQDGLVPTFPSYFGEMPPVPSETTFDNDTIIPFKPPEKKSSKYRKEDLNSTRIFPVSDSSFNSQNFTDFKPYLLAIDSQASPSAKSLKYSRIYSKKTKQLRLEPYKTEDIYSPPPPPPPTPDSELPTDTTQQEESINQRIVLPTIGYINSLTTAHFGKGSSTTQQSHNQEEPKTQLTHALNLTQALNYLRSNRNQNEATQTTTTTTTQPPTEIEIRTFEPMKLKKFRSKYVPKSKRDVYLIRERDKRSEKEDYEGNDESDLPHDEKNEQIAQDERERIEEENLEKEKYEKDLRKEISTKEKEILKETFRNIGVQRDIQELFPEFPPTSGQSDDDDDDDESDSSAESQEPIDSARYPFYFSKNLPENSALRYATNPRDFPVKSGFRMEFYESRDRSIQCPDFHPDLDDLPNSNSTEYSENQPGENQRLVGLGDKIACLRMKYFGDGRNPLDNPIFKEKEIDYVGKPRKGFKRKGFKASQSRVTLKKQKPILEVMKTQKAQPKPKTPKPNQPPPRTLTKPRKPLQSNSKKLNPTQPNPSITRAPIDNKTQKAQISPKTPDETRDNIYATTPIGIPEIDFSSLNKQTDNWSKQETVQQPNPSTTIARILIPDNCLHSITSLASRTANKNLIIDCLDAILIKEIINGIGYLRIIPKVPENPKEPPKEADESDWVPIPGYIIPGKSRQTVSRKTDEVVIGKNETNQNTSSDHYVIDELKEDENVRKGEVVEDMNHYLKLMETDGVKLNDELEEKQNQTRRRREAQADSKTKPKKKITILKKPTIEIFEKNIDKSVDNENPRIRTTERTEQLTNESEASSTKPFAVAKRKLTRLSGSDFLTRYHKNKAQSFTPEKTADFWKISSSSGVKSTNKPLTRQKDFESTTAKPLTEKSLDKLITKESSTSDRPRAPTTQTVTVTRTESKASYKKDFVSPKTTTEKPQEYPKIPQLNLIPEKLARKPNIIDASEFRKSTTTPNPGRNAIKPETSIKSTKDESNENPTKNHTKTENPRRTGSTETQQKPLNSNQSKPNETEDINKTTPPPPPPSTPTTTTTIGPILYYVVNGRTGRGKWITNYEQRRKLYRNPGIIRKSRKFNSKHKNERRGKKGEKFNG